MHNSSFTDSDTFFGIMVILMILQFIVGVVQLVGAFIRTIIRLNKGQRLGNLKIYWIMVAVYFFVFLILYFIYLYLSNKNDDTDWNAYMRNLEEIALLIKAAYVWFYTAWGIAIWYNIKVVFNKNTQTQSQSDV